ncbi:hypothetical protein [Streptomyces sp. CB02261]|uniref:hypothetical protein n=1 Tax=Streptomyces sp. CB02261 TaxID=1703940 RepID=UPI00093900E6|nr:hypothetical protein [Streptomyces sp. CB02261]OKJ52590.1 hypothetical protein AMK29_30680 [Streptomyces sp. CB02261]
MHDASHPAAGGGYFDRLDADWAALRADPALRQAVTDWVADGHLTDGIAAVTDSWAGSLTPEQLLAALRPTGGVTDALTDAVLRALLQRAAGRDRSAVLAGRVIVQAMLPAAVRITRGQVRATGGRTRDAVGHVTVTALYEVARSGRIHLRPGRPAANLALDTLRQVLAELAAEQGPVGEDLAAAEQLADRSPGPYEVARARTVRAAAVEAGLHAGPAEDAATAPARLELLELLLDAMRDGALSTADAQALAWHHISGGIPDAEAAARAGITDGAWQRRRSRARARLTASLRPQAAA